MFIEAMAVPRHPCLHGISASMHVDGEDCRVKGRFSAGINIALLCLKESQLECFAVQCAMGSAEAELNMSSV